MSSSQDIMAQHVVEPPTRATVMAAEVVVEIGRKGRMGARDLLVLSTAFGVWQVDGLGRWIRRWGGSARDG